MRILALDLGDVWTGTALSDPLKIIATPYKTIRTTELLNFLEQMLNEEEIEKIVVGHPRTMRGKESQQTKKIVAQKETIEQHFPSTPCILWDERLSSKQAKSLQKNKSKVDSNQEHSIAAALVLQTYLQFLS